MKDNPANIFIYASPKYISFMRSQRGLEEADEADEVPPEGHYTYTGEFIASPR